MLGSKTRWCVCAGNDGPFVNNYGVWVDEFRELGLEGTLDVTWEDALCYFGEGEEKRIGRAYGRVCRYHVLSTLCPPERVCGTTANSH